MEPRLQTGPDLSTTIHLPSKEPGAMPSHAVRCCALCRCAMPCFALQCFVMQCSTLRNATPCYDMLGSTVLFYAMPCRALPCIAHPLAIIALLGIRLCK